MARILKISGIVLTALLVVVLSLAVVSCNDNTSSGGEQSNKVLPTLTKVKVVPALVGHNGDEESDVCLMISGGKVENFHIEITISNPDRREILSFNYNDVTYTSDLFDNESTTSVIIVKNLVSPVQEGDFEVKIDEIKYAEKNGTAKILGLKNNVKKVRINPAFTLTLDMSEANLAEGVDPVFTSTVDFLGPLGLPSSLDMNDSETTEEDRVVYGHYGYIFDGWYTEKEGMGTRVDYNSNYTYYKDLTLYAHYARSITYREEEGYLVATGLTEAGKSTTFPIEIPREIGGKTFRKIANMAFSGIGAGKTFIMPDTIVEIGDYAFNNASGIKIDLGSVEKIGTSAFLNCGLITLGKNKNFIGEANLPNTLKEIGTSAFRGTCWYTRAKNPYREGSFRPDVPTLMLPASLEKIGNYAFMESGFYGVYFHTNTTLDKDTIGVSVFEGSKSLTSLYLGYDYTESGPLITTSVTSGIKDIPEKTFYNCTALKNTLSSINVKLNEGLESVGNLAFASSGEGMVSLNYLPLPDSLQEIGTQAFANTGLTKVTFNKNSRLKTLGEYAFENSKFEEITLYSLTTYGRAPFWGNTKIKAINILAPSMPTYVETNMWGAGLTRKTKYYVKKELLNAYRSEASSWSKDDVQDYICAYDYITEDVYGTRLCYEPIDENGELDFNSTNVRITSVFNLDREIRVPKSFIHNDITYQVVSVGKYFVHEDVTKVRLPSTLERIEWRAFYTCDVLYDLVWMNDNTEIAKGKNKDIALKYIGQDAFNGSAITSFYSNTALEYIGKQAFHNCNNLATVVLDHGSQIDVMGSAFSQGGLKTLVIGLNVERIYDSAFQNNKDLTVVLIRLNAVPESTEDNYPGLGSAPLGYCDNINKIYLFSDNALIAFTSSKTPNGQINGWSGVKNANGSTKYEIYKGTWEEALDKYNVI